LGALLFNVSGWREKREKKREREREIDFEIKNW